MIKGVSHEEGKHRRTCRRFEWLCVWVRSESGRPEWAAAQVRVPERLIALILSQCICSGSARGKVGIKERKRCCNNIRRRIPFTFLSKKRNSKIIAHQHHP